MLQKLEALQSEAITLVQKANEVSILRELEVRFLGRKGELTLMLRGLSGLSKEERPLVGKASNEIKQCIEKAIIERETVLEKQRLDALAETEWEDPTAPAEKREEGGLHPITAFIEELEEVFGQMGFSVVDGPEIETDWYNFEALNFDKDHPARDSQDTFFVQKGEKEEGYVLRTQTSNMQIHHMEEHKPPIRIIAPGKTFRKDSDATHSPMFHQFEGLMVDSNISLPNLKEILLTVSRRLLRNDALDIRFRTSYFPFVEPGFEVDVSCVICKGKKKTCSLCKGTGWLEVLGAGMVHPNVLRNCNIDPEKYSGFAFGAGIERFLMLRYGINDMRLLYENDKRFLEQFF